MTNPTELVRMRKSTRREIQKALPDMTDPDRFDLVFNTSVIKVKDKVGAFLYGKNMWDKATKKTKRK